jgi:hypothetical protein
MSSNDLDHRNRNQPMRSQAGGGRGRQGVGEAFLMSMIRQIARSIGSAIVRMFLGGRR